eukprot:CAMPEP_0172617774 /NCGR_PEP_ID=MMETSP1068-20121228/72504_1 /TAXON_ID=35684 /ORGANISM="Pseudopedinella elastica, Strain CCMP716" /LENGTH=48 /DNA_ID= /DNA_START= /DNA_END= /DNA_ORIENTATION=
MASRPKAALCKHRPSFGFSAPQADGLHLLEHTAKKEEAWRAAPKSRSA